LMDKLLNMAVLPLPGTALPYQLAAVDQLLLLPAPIHVKFAGIENAQP